jgi:hypothetical protein
MSFCVNYSNISMSQEFLEIYKKYAIFWLRINRLNNTKILHNTQILVIIKQ